MLLDFERPAGAAADDSVGMPGVSKSVLRVREVSLTKMIEAQAKMRLQRAMSDRTRPAGQLMDLKPGDLIDFHRKEQQKDVPGWRGPARVTDLSRIDEGVIQFDFQGRSMSARPADVRRALMHLVFMAAASRGPRTSPWDVVARMLGCMQMMSWMTLGWELRSGGWSMTAETPKHYDVYLAALHCAACGLHIAGVVTVRLAAGAVTLPGVHGADDSVVCWWHRSRTDLVNSLYMDGTQKLVLRRLVEHSGSPWNDLNHVHFVQFLISDPDVVDVIQRNDPTIPHLGGAHVPGLHDVQWRTTPGDRGLRRSRDPDEASNNPAPLQAPRVEQRGITRDRDDDAPEDEPPAARPRLEPQLPQDGVDVPVPPDDPEELLAWLAADASQYVGSMGEVVGVGVRKDSDALDQTSVDAERLESTVGVRKDSDGVEQPDGVDVWAGVCTSTRPPPIEEYTDQDFYHGLHKINAEISSGSGGGDSGENYGDLYREMLVEPSLLAVMTGISIEDIDVANLDDDCLITLCFHGSDARSAIIERDTDNLTSAEKKQFSKELMAARTEELLRWTGFKAFHRRSRVGSQNRIDCTWVDKWKYVDGKRVIKSRLCLRGFKDLEGASLQTYAGTTTRWGQRVVTAIAAQKGWPIVIADVGCAFLRGLTFKELSELQGTPIRVVCMELPADSVALLRTIPGFETFSLAVEVLELDKPGFGLKDAPHAWGVRFDKHMHDKQGLRPTHADSKLYLGHERLGMQPAISAAVASHVDDLKMTAPKARLEKMLALLAADFGELKIKWHKFECCGEQVDQDPSTMAIKTHQNHYVAALKPIPLTHIPRADDDKDATTDMHGPYMSLLGAIGWTVIGRADHCVYVAALQRHAKQPKNKHLRALNAVLTYLKAHPTHLLYQRLTGPLALVAVADSAYRREEHEDHAEGLAMKGAMFALRSMAASDGPGGRWMLLEWYSRKQRHVTRNTWSSELFAVVDAADFLMVLGSVFYEIVHGVVPSARDLVKLREGDHSPLPMQVCTDGMSLLTALENIVAKIPTEASTLHHVQWLQELTRTRVLDAAFWVDTRDMIADGMTKGSVARNIIRDAQETGQWRLEHDWRRYPADERTKTKAAERQGKSFD